MRSGPRQTLALLLAVVALALLGGGAYYYYFVGKGAAAREAGNVPGPVPARTYVGGGITTTAVGTAWPDTSVCFQWPQYGYASIDENCAGKNPAVIGGGGFRCVNPSLTLWSGCQYADAAPV
jgi:hypothetical protein